MVERRALERLRTLGPVFRSRDAVAAGVAWRDLYALRDAGEILELSRGLFQLADRAGTSNPDFVAVCARAPQGTICLDSALAYWDLSDDIPHRVHLAVPAGTHPPTIDYPPTRVHVFQASTFDQRRPTRDVDLLAIAVANDIDTIAAVVRDVAMIDIDDGVVFATDRMTARQIREHDERDVTRGNLRVHH